jgi:hypothetical protein
MCDLITALKDHNLYDPVKELVEDIMTNGKSTRAKQNQGITDEQEARNIVRGMWHRTRGTKHTGEIYSMECAKEVYIKYGLATNTATIPEVYIAINAQCHDYCNLFFDWFKANSYEDIKKYVIESAVSFWFRDEDYLHSSKVYRYFKG